MQAKPVRRFKKEEAESKVGTVVRTRAAFWNVPYGTRGRVVDTYQVSTGWFDVVVEWELAGKPRDRFAKDPFEEFLADPIFLTPSTQDNLALA